MWTSLYNSEQEMHCVFCCAPKDTYEPFKTYNGRCCELYSDVLDLVYDDDSVSFEQLLRRSGHLKEEYPDIPDFPATIKEIFDILEDCGVINWANEKLKIV